MKCEQKLRSNPRESHLTPIIVAANTKARRKTFQLRKDIDEAAVKIAMSKEEREKYFLNIQEVLRKQHSIFVKVGVGQYSVYSQVQQLLQLPHPHGLFCIDFDDTLLNTAACYGALHECYHVYQGYHPRLHHRVDPFNELVPCTSSKHLKCYNGTSLNEWKSTLQMLNMRGFTNVLVTDRLRICGEDEVLCEVVYDDLAGLLQGTIFAGELLYKGTILQYLKYEFEKKGILICNWNICLLEDNPYQQQNARLCNFLVIETMQQMQTDNCDFIQRVRRVHLRQEMQSSLESPTIFPSTPSLAQPPVPQHFYAKPPPPQDPFSYFCSILSGQASEAQKQGRGVSSTYTRKY